MKQDKTYAFVRYTVEGFHRWPGALRTNWSRSYLADRHRHLFHVEVRLQVYHDNREVELHDLLDFCKEHTPSGELDEMSCEAIARDIAYEITRQFGDERAGVVSVSEDGEVGAIVEF